MISLMQSCLSVLIVLVVHTCEGHKIYKPHHSGFGIPDGIWSLRHDFIFGHPDDYQRTAFKSPSVSYGLFERGPMFPHYEQNIYDPRMMMPQNPELYNKNRGFINRDQGYEFHHKRIIPQHKGHDSLDQRLITRHLRYDFPDQESITRNQGYASPDQRLIPRNLGYDSLDQNLITRHQRYDSPDQGSITRNQGYDSPDQRLIPRNQGYDSLDQNLITRAQGYGSPDQGLIPRDQGYDSTDQVLISRDQGYDSPASGGTRMTHRQQYLEQGYESPTYFRGRKSADTVDPNKDQNYEATYNGRLSYEVSPPPTFSVNRPDAQQTTGRSNQRVQQSRAQRHRSGKIIMDRQDSQGVIRKGDIGAYGGLDGFPYLGGVCGGHPICKDGGRSVGVANGFGAGSLEEFNRRRRTGENKDLRLYEEALRNRPRAQEN